MLKSLNDLGYAVEWRVINAAEYGMPQRRRRIFFIAYHQSTKAYRALSKANKESWITEEGIMAKVFPVKNSNNKVFSFSIENDLVSLSDTFNKGEKLSPFLNTGIFIDGKVSTQKTQPNYSGEEITLGDVLQNGEVSEEFFIPENEYSKWEYLKGAKKEIRTSKNGFTYNYSEGKMIFPDALDNASRTIITGEGGKSPSRFKHVVATRKGLRRLTPVELERLNMFPDNHTSVEGISDTKRAFFMGNALVVGIVEKIGEELYDRINM